ncbi:hypothetical protein [Cohnella zeiphila]|uniref:Polymerase nucleotidyl transferase domain-containing protein n=1 Tax=Cohnella zeiphila TaxID=2761120 RepID=A0A7X0VYD0_9BACL|nr:hypothetical protein [Cohnella zeiphila]
MRVGDARKAAAAWVAEHEGRVEGFEGAYISGSTVGMPDDAMLAPASDVDIVVVLSGPEPPVRLGKFRYRDALLEVTYLSWSQLSSPEKVLSSYYLAGGFRTDTILADPSGRLRELQAEVSPHFAEPAWVRRRLENVRQRIEDGLRSLDPSAPWHGQVMGWLFPTGVTAHLPLVAALRNPTVRLRYVAAKDVLREYGREDLYPELLGRLGCADLSPQRVEAHVDGLARTFDAAAAAAKTPFFFSSDITAAARPIAIDGSRELIRAGLHREAMFWIVATFARCHYLLAADAPELEASLAPAFRAAVADLGIASSGDMARRAQDTLSFLPKLWSAAEEIAAANPFPTQ